ncbi:hypothetical protein PspLS_11626 [Pyricularia sp. CBS 133598]|nr:hypothetical protein PspLS_11626 [Pyricularia sp. CBS 133598]
MAFDKISSTYISMAAYSSRGILTASCSYFESDRATLAGCVAECAEIEGRTAASLKTDTGSTRYYCTLLSFFQGC